MTVANLLELLEQRQIQIQAVQGDLVVRAARGSLDAGLAESLRQKKGELLVELHRRQQRAPASATARYRTIAAGPDIRITPDLLTLVSLSQEAIDAVVATVAGGAANVQDIYPLAPLQEGILFHHLMEQAGDAYLLFNLLGFASKARLERFLSALQRVIDRHDILRTGIAWEGLEQPVQVVRRQVKLPVELIELDGAQGDIARQLEARYNPAHYRLDVRQAPLLRCHVARDEANGRWILHVLAHHLVSDHRTLELILEEVWAIERGQLERLPTPVPFRKFVAQARMRGSPHEQAAFFKQMLGDIDEPTAPFGILDVRGNAREATEASQMLAPELAGAIRRQVRKLGVSAASLMHLAWALVLARTTGRQDVVFGTVLFGRMQAGAQANRVLGMFINTLPVRIRVDEQGVGQSLKSIHALLVQLLRYEHASLTVAQRSSAVPAQTPLFTSLLNYRYTSQDPGAGAIHPGEGIELLGGRESTHYPVSVDIDDLGQDFTVKVQTVPSLGAQRLCDFMAKAVAQVARALEQEPAQSIRQLDVLSEAERQQLLHQWSRGERMEAGADCIHELFEVQALERPGKIALLQGECRWSYGEINARANRLAHYLMELGVRPDDRVALYGPRSPEIVMAMLAVLKAGGAYVPLDSNYPAERLAYMVQDSEPTVVLYHGAPLHILTEHLGVGTPLLDLRGDADCWQHHSESNPSPLAVGLHGGHLAYVIYTSGSTGRPKGVMVEHRGVVNQVTMLAESLGLGAQDRMLQFASLSFDASVEEVFASWARGATLVLRTDEWLASAREFWALCEAHKINVVDLPTQFWEQLAREPSPVPASVRQIIIGGEAVSERALQAWFATSGHRPRLLNTYGPTEATISATMHEVTRSGLSTIGRPSANTHVYILDERMQPVPAGVSGELYIGGVQVARGYLNQPELTAQRFIEDPFVAGGRLYKTGDLGRWLADGSIEYLGRNDFQVKIRGFRIELGEIEAKLARVEGVREVVVMARAPHDAPGEKRLVAYYTGESLSAEQLREHAAGSLPQYMVPAAFVHLESMPLTPNRKLDRKALPAPQGDAFASRQYEAPQGELEQTLARLWCEVLKLERVGRHDNFFELGGHSLLAVQLVSRIRKVLNVEVPLSELFTHPELAALAARLESASPATLPQIPLVSRDSRLRLSLAQQRLWFLSQIEGVGAAYHIRGAVRLSGALNREVLRQALQQIVQRHESVRTCFELSDGEPLQRIQPSAELVLHEQDLRGHPAVESEAQRLSEAHAQLRFDLQRDLPVRVLLLRLGEEEYLLHVVMHHIASDGWSTGVLLKELSALYGAYLQGAADPLPPLSIQYADYAAWQRGWLAAGELAQQSQFWRDNLSGAPTLLELPTDRPRPARQDLSGDSVPVQLNSHLSERLQELSQRHGVTLYMTMLASWAVLLSRLSNQEEVVIGSPVAGRNRAEIEPLIGFFVNTLALRLDLQGEPTLAQVLERTKGQVLAAQRHQDLPFDQVVEVLKPARSLAHTPVFQVMLDWHNTPESDLRMEGVRVSPVDSPLSTAQFDLTLSLTQGPAGITGILNYATALFDRGTVERYLEYWMCLLRGLVGEDNPCIARVNLLPETERRRVLHEWNETAEEYPRELCIHQLFETQVARTPEATAVVYGEQRLSYGELNARANQLAHHLRTLGVGPDSRVAVCVERSVEMVVAILATLKAGGAYVPLDPAYASERLGLTLADSRPAVVLIDATGRQALGPIEAGASKVLDLQVDAAHWAGASHDNLDLQHAGLRPQHLAYVIYTSGSTGLPKGVMVEHAQVTRLFEATRAWFDFSSRDTWSLFHSFGFDFSVWELWGALLHGGRLVIVPIATARSPSEFYELLCEQGVTVLNQTPSAFQQLIAAQAHSTSKHRLRYIIFGGEALELHTLRPWYERNDEHATQLVNMYGITETTVHVTYLALQAADAERLGPSPIGVRIPDLRLYVLDRQRQPVPVGVSGELYVGGAGVARGYLNQPELTAQRFIEDPFVAGGRLYKTGDLGRWLADGSIEYLGRNDFQVKIRGFRIELGEIEAQLARVEGVREVVVMARAQPDEPGEKRLVAYYTGESLSAEQLREHATDSLPQYMVPAAFVHLERMPLTPNGKLDRKALPAPQGDAYASREYEAPQGEIEPVLARLWCEVLKLERVGRHDNFFELGGHSLLIVSLIERMRQEGLYTDVQTLFTAPTLAAMAAQSGTHHDEVKVPPNLIPHDTCHITPQMLTLVSLSQEAIDAIVQEVEGGAANVQDIYPLAPLQEGILFHHLMQREGDPYVMLGLLAFKSRQRLESFLSALQRVIDRHDILRTGIAWEGLEQPVQVVRRQVKLPVEFIELDAREGDIARQLEARYDPRHYRLDVRQAPLLRCHAAHDEANGRWVLSVLSHHLVDDNTTVKLLLAEAYAIEQGHLDQLPTPVPLRDFVAQARLGLSPQEHAAFFKQMLGDIDATTAPFGLLDVQGDGSGIAEAEQILPPELSLAIRRQARRLGVSTASVMHLAWALVLARTTGRRDVVFGTVLFGRMQGRAQADRALGLFINTLPLRINVGEQGVEQTLKRTHALLAQLLRHEHAPLVLAQRSSAIPAQTPLFTTLMNYRHSAEQAPRAPSLGEDMEYLSGYERTNYPLTLSVDDLGQGFALTVQASTPIAPWRLCVFMQSALEQLVRSLEEAPHLSTCDIDVLPPLEREQLLIAWNDTARSHSQELCVQQLFETQVEQAPGAAAVVHGEERLSYRELNARANQLARHLRELGVCPDSRVAICVERSVEMIVAMLATLKAGGAYVPLDPHYPVERLHAMLQDCEPVAVLTHARVGESVYAQLGCFVGQRADRARVIDLQADASQWRRKDTGNLPLAGLMSHHLAYVIYTSGSTGHPKGVMIEHRNLTNLIAWHIHAFGLKSGSRSASTAGVGFDATTWEIWPSLCSGGNLLLPPPESRLGDPQGLLQWWQAQELDVSFLVTPLAELAYATGRANRGMRTLLIGGDRLQHWPESLPDGQALVNNYGPTETTVVATSGRLYEGDAVLHIGRPIANTRVYILDERMQPVPAGVSGELYIGGAGVARGYLNQPELTAQRFIEDPFVAGERLYKTGDLGRWLEDGNIEYLGRNDFQVKIRGFRIELGEIEAQLARAEGVREVVVMARAQSDAPGEKRLVAYYTGESLTAEQLREHAAGSLPQYMVPAAFVHLESMPLTPNGKLDRKALPAPQGDAFVSRQYQPPQGELEQTLARLWCEVLRLERVGRHDNFFELGGHSLLAVQLVSRIRKAFGVEVALSELFTHPQLAALATRLEAAAPATLSQIPRVSRDGRLQLSLAQQRLWFLSQMEEVSAAYHIRGAVRLSGALNTEVLQRALQRIVQRHEALRTCFELCDGEPLQRVKPSAELVVPEQDLRGHPAPESEAQRLCEAHAQISFNLQQELPVRVLLLRLAPEEYLLQVVMHHIASDGWSIGVLLEELNALYGAYLRGAEDPLPPLSIQYADYAAWQRGWLGAGELPQQSQFWRDNLSGAPTLLELPADRPRPVQQDLAGDSVPVQLDSRLSERLQELSQRHGVTLYMTMLASWAVLLARLSNQEEVVIGSPVAGRNRAEIEPLIGFFVNTLALRLDLQNEPTVAQLLERTKAQVLAAQRHQDLPFDQVVEAVKPPRSLAHTPVFQVMLDWHNTPESDLRMEGVRVSPVDSPLSTAQFDLTLSLTQAQAGISGVLNYATALFDRDTVQRYLGYWMCVLQALVSEDNPSITRVSLLPQAERQRVLYEWNETAEAYPRELCVHQLFEAQVARTPDATAVVYEEQRLSYRELNARANQLAHYLRELGVMPDARVALCASRGVPMVVALLGILKAGGVYVPLDPDYPGERIAYMLSDSAPVAVLSVGAGRAIVAQYLHSGLPVLDLEADAACWSHLPESNPNPQAVGLTAEHLAYIIYTSGSTGRPKGVMIEHRGLVNYTLEAIRWFELSCSDTVLQQNSLNFDLSIEESLPALLAGATLVPSNEPFGVLDSSKRQGDFSVQPSVVHLTAAHWHNLVGQWSQSDTPVQAWLGSVRLINVTGDALSMHKLQQWESLKPDEVRLINTYGPTESTVSCSAAHVHYNPQTSRVSIGKPFANTPMYILDQRMQPVPVGVSGELYIGGVQVARGYLNQPELTAQRFIEDPFVAGGRLYKTGDLGRWLPDGSIEYLGRNDFQVKIRGFRIELGEIEAQLARLEGVREVVVLARKEALEEKHLVAYYTGESLTAQQLREHAAGSLPQYMVPAAFVYLERMPLTPNGKLDRKALPAPQGDAFASRQYEAPQGELEQTLARLWCEVLRLERVGRHDNFFELGGHSLLIVSLIERMRQEGLHAEVTLLFTAPTLAEAATACAKLKEIVL